MTNDDNLLGSPVPPTDVSGVLSTPPIEVVPTSPVVDTPLVPTSSPVGGVKTPEATPNALVVSTPSANTLSVTNVNAASSGAAVADFDAITDSLLGQIGDLGIRSNFKMMVFGYPGRTKSSFLGSAPHNLVYDFEDGMIAAKMAHHVTGRPLAPGIKSIPFTDLAQADELIERLQVDHPAFAQWNVFSVDTISTMHKRMLEYVMRREKAKRPSMNEYDPQTEHYTEVNEVLTRFVQGICDIKNKDIIVLAHAQTVEPKGKPAKTFADFSEKLYNKLAAKMDVVAYVDMFETDDGNGNKMPRPVYRVVSEGTIQCKSRIPLPPEILDPTWEQFKVEFEKAKAEGSLAAQED